VGIGGPLCDGPDQAGEREASQIATHACRGRPRIRR
jgi:hypothetical protein